MEDLITAIELFDLETYLIEHGGEELQPGQWTLQCPVCWKPKLVVDEKKRAWHCWVCELKVQIVTTMGMQSRTVEGAGGLIDLIQILDEVDRKDAIALILAGANTAMDLAALPEVELAGAIPAANLAPREIAPPDGMVPIRVLHPYCVERGITAEDVYLFRVHWCPAGRYANRLVFPVYEHGVLVYWQARATWKPGPGDRFIKSLNPPRHPDAAVSSDVLFNLDLARQYPRVVITEGPIDAIHVGPDAVCSFGKRLHSTQVAKLIRAGVRHVDLMWDGPSETEPYGAYQEMDTTARQIARMFESVRVVRLPRGDPGDWPTGQLRAFQGQFSAEYLRGGSVLEAI